MQSYNSIIKILSKIEYKNWRFYVEDRHDCMTLQIVFNDTCVLSGREVTQYCRKWFISKHMTDNEVIRTAFMAVEKAEFHELCEKFKYKGVSINNPHINLEKIAENEDLFCNLDKRKEYEQTTVK